MDTYKININNEIRTISVDKNKPLLWVLRDELGLTGTKYGCGVGQCGACTAHLDGRPVRSCGIAISSIGDKAVNTIEHISKESDHSVLQAWKSINVPQCGFCQTGQLMASVALLKNNPNPTDSDIDLALHGNICRCGTYFRIRKAIKKVAVKDS